MLDIAGIILSSIMMLMIIVRSVRLDRLQPWFPVARRQESTGNAILASRRRS
jgi:hypothetical protein